jgi:hypothetical protein
VKFGVNLAFFAPWVTMATAVPEIDDRPVAKCDRNKKKGILNLF